MLQLVVNTLFICNVIRVLWSKVRESHNTSELDRMKKSVKAALMLIPLLGIPNIMQTIPFSPTQENIVVSILKEALCYFFWMHLKIRKRKASEYNEIGFSVVENSVK
uniref:Uncharacterized protein n=1 Tax=Panagrolaimus superbus TaxID=310955 RepID=A0A914Z361_9BILA